MYLVILISPLRSFRVQFFRLYNLLPSPLQTLINSTPPPLFFIFHFSLKTLSLCSCLCLCVSLCSCVCVRVCLDLDVLFTPRSDPLRTVPDFSVRTAFSLSRSLFSSISLIHERIYIIPRRLFSFLFLLFMALSFAS